MRADRFLRGFAAAAMALIALGGCVIAPPGRSAVGGEGGAGLGGNASGGATGSGGSTGKGGSLASGGTTGSGGAPDTGGTSAGGSTTGSGGVTTGNGGITGQGGIVGGGGAGARSGTGGTAGSTATNCALGPSFKWSSTDSLIDPMIDDSHSLSVALREPTVVNYGGKYTLYATVGMKTGNPTIEALSFVNWTDAGRATVYFMDNNTAFGGNHAGPQIFYVAGQKKWYLLTQATGPSYSTASDPSLTSTMTKPTSFFSSAPSIVTQNAGSGPGWTDFWVICDSTNCHMFFGNNNGYLFRSQTPLGSFPGGFGTPVVVMKSSTANDFYGGVSVYKVKGSSKYLLLAEAVGTSWHYIRSWTADALDGTWTTLADTESNPFAGLSNLTFSSSSWTKDVSEGELVRDGYDETMTVNPCNLQYVYQGRNAYTTDPPTAYPWRVALLTKTN